MGAEYLDQLEKRVNYCCKRIEIFWRDCKRNKTFVLDKRSDWLSKNKSFITGHRKLPPKTKSVFNKHVFDLLE